LLVLTIFKLNIGESVNLWDIISQQIICNFHLSHSALRTC